MSGEPVVGERDGAPDDTRLGPDRWLASAGRARQVVLIGDSTTLGLIDDETGEEEQHWVDLLATELGAPGPAPIEGFRGLWRGREWARQGAWTKATRTDTFDVAPFGHVYVSSGAWVDGVVDEATWTKPVGTVVSAFDLYAVAVPDLGDWQYRVDDGPWQQVGPADRTVGLLRAHPVDQPVHERVSIRGFDGTRPCVAAIAGIAVHPPTSAAAPRTLVHHLGIARQQLGTFCRSSAGDPFALLDVIRPDLVIVTFTNDVLWDVPHLFEGDLRRLVDRVEPYADVLLISPFEQRAPRSVIDAATTEGSRRVRSATAAFLASDVTQVVRGAHIPSDPETTITNVLSEVEVELSTAATGDGEGGELVIGEGREVDIQRAYRAATRRTAEAKGCRYLDVYEAWSDAGSTGWDAAAAAGLMVDRLHQTPQGHHDIAARVLRVLETPRPRPREPLGEGGAPAYVALPEVVPGPASVVAPTSGSVVLAMPVELSFASVEVVTVEWHTRVVDDAAHVQAPSTDYVEASGTVTFAPGETSATVPITVTGNSTGRDERVVLSFTDPTNATMGGFWGLGFGTILPAP